MDLSGLFLFQGLVTSTLLAHFSFLPGMSLGFTFLLAPHFVPLCSASFRAVPFMKTFLLALASAQGFSELPLFLCGSSLRGLVLSDFFFSGPRVFWLPQIAGDTFWSNSHPGSFEVGWWFGGRQTSIPIVTGIASLPRNKHVIFGVPACACGGVSALGASSPRF